MAIQRGEIYFVDLNPVQGREQAGQRPVLVLSIDIINQLPLVVTVVVGTKGENLSRLPNERSGARRREWFTVGDGIPLFSATITGSQTISIIAGG